MINQIIKQETERAVALISIDLHPQGQFLPDNCFLGCGLCASRPDEDVLKKSLKRHSSGQMARGLFYFFPLFLLIKVVWGQHLIIKIKISDVSMSSRHHFKVLL